MLHSSSFSIDHDLDSILQYSFGNLLHYGMAPRIISWPDNFQSDGVSTHRPNPKYEPNDRYFKIQLAKKIALDRQMNPTNVILSALPAGYAGFQKARDDGRVDYYVWGHPSGLRLDSIINVFRHFKHLSDHGINVPGCTCKPCVKTTARRPRTANTAPPTARLEHDASSSSQSAETDVDREEVIVVKSLQPEHPQRTHDKPDRDSEHICLKTAPNAPQETAQILRLSSVAIVDQGSMIQSILAELQLGVRIDRSMSQDTASWPFTNVDAQLQHMQNRSQHLPRIGEAVLYSQDQEPLLWDQQITTWRLNKAELRLPAWQAGLVVDVDMQNELCHIRILVEKVNHPKQCHIAFSHVRPMQFWPYCMNGLRSHYPQSIIEALRSTNSISLVCAHRLRAPVDGPNGPTIEIKYRGVFIGHDLLLVGDLVSLLADSKSPQATTEYLKITSIKAVFINLQSEEVGLCLRVYGRPYTTQVGCSFEARGHLANDVLMRSIGVKLFEVLDPRKPNERYGIPYTRVLGRCFERNAIEEWFSYDENYLESGMIHYNPRLDGQWTTAWSRAQQIGLKGLE